MPYDERYQIRDEEIEEKLKILGDIIGNALPDGWAYGLFLVKFGDNPIEQGGGYFWISSAQREGMVDIVSHWVEQQKKKAK